MQHCPSLRFSHSFSMIIVSHRVHSEGMFLSLSSFSISFTLHGPFVDSLGFPYIHHISPPSSHMFRTCMFAHPSMYHAPQENVRSYGPLRSHLQLPILRILHNPLESINRGGRLRVQKIEEKQTRSQFRDSSLSVDSARFSIQIVV
jgi:hypothetical protein